MHSWKIQYILKQYKNDLCLGILVLSKMEKTYSTLSLIKCSYEICVEQLFEDSEE